MFINWIDLVFEFSLTQAAVYSSMEGNIIRAYLLFPHTLWALYDLRRVEIQMTNLMNNFNGSQG